MGFRARKSFKVMPGVRMTVTPRGVSTSVGVNGARITASSRGRVTRTVGIPGSGLSHTKTVRQGGSRPSPARAPAPLPVAPKPPGLMAPKWQRELFKAVQANDKDAYARIGTEYTDARIAAITLEGFARAGAHEYERATVLLKWAWDHGGNVEDDWFLSTYLSRSTIGVPVADGVSAELPISRDAVGLLLVELLQEAGKGDDEAIEVAENLEPSAMAAVSLAELYVQAGRFDDVIDLTNGVENTDDATALLLTYRGIALNERGHHTAARETLGSALKSKSRDDAIRHLALIERSRSYLAEGKKAMARKDLERVYAENSGYPGIRTALAELGQAASE